MLSVSLASALILLPACTSVTGRQAAGEWTFILHDYAYRGPYQKSTESGITLEQAETTCLESGCKLLRWDYEQKSGWCYAVSDPDELPLLLYRGDDDWYKYKEGTTTTTTTTTTCADVSGPYISLNSDERVYVEQTGCQAKVAKEDYFNDPDSAYKVIGNTIVNFNSVPGPELYVGVVQSNGDVAFNGSYDRGLLLQFRGGYWEKQICNDLPGWKDWWGYTCGYYAVKFDRCTSSAHTGCCACNGGKLTTVTTTTALPEQMVCLTPLSCTSYMCPADYGTSQSLMTKRSKSVYCNGGGLSSCTNSYSGGTWDGFLLVNACCETKSTGCFDKVVNGTMWHDSRGKDYSCQWYAVGNRCKQDGSKFKGFGYSAKEVCCACQGTKTCNDVKVLGEEWSGLYGSCERYNSASECAETRPERWGINASRACCSCGGGGKASIMECVDLVPPGQKEYRSPSGRTCSDYRYSRDRLNKCKLSFSDRSCRYGGMCPSEACCFCGGGKMVLTSTTTTTTTGECTTPVPCSTYGCPAELPYHTSKSVNCRATPHLETISEHLQSKKIPSCPRTYCNHSKFCWAPDGEGAPFVKTCCSKAPQRPRNAFCYELTSSCKMYPCPPGYTRKDSAKAPCLDQPTTNYAMNGLYACSEVARWGEWENHEGFWGPFSTCCEPEHGAEVASTFEKYYKTNRACSEAKVLKGTWLRNFSLSDCAWECSRQSCKYVSFFPRHGGAYPECFLSETCDPDSDEAEIYMKWSTTTTTTSRMYCALGTKCTELTCPVGYVHVSAAKWVPCAMNFFGGRIEDSSNFALQDCDYYRNEVPNPGGGLAKCPDERPCWTAPAHGSEVPIHECCTNASTAKMAAQDEEKAADMPRTLAFAASASVSCAGVLMTILLIKFRQSALQEMQTPLIQA